MSRKEINKLAPASWRSSALNFALNFVVAMVWLLKYIVRLPWRAWGKRRGGNSRK